MMAIKYFSQQFIRFLNIPVRILMVLFFVFSSLNLQPPTVVHASTDVSLIATADTFMNSGSTKGGYNYGGATTLELNPYYQAGGSDQYRAPLIKWDLSSIPTDAIVTAASLTFYVTKGETAYTYSLYNMRRTWTEGTNNGATGSGASWNYYGAGTGSWGTVGAANTTSDRYNANLWDAVASDFGITGNKTFAMNASGVAAVQGWITTPANNFGLTIQNYSGSATGNWIAASRENTSGYTKPTLNITYDLPTTPNITTTGTLTAFSSPVGIPSAEQSYTVAGTNLSTDIVITPPTDFELSLTSGSGFSSSAINLTPASGTVASTPVYVRLNPTTAAAYSATITHDSTGATQKTVAVSGSSVPNITTTGTLSAFSAATGAYSTEKNYTVSAVNLTANLDIAAPADFEISTTSGSGFGPSVSLPPTNGVVGTTTIYARFMRATAGASSGNITHDSSGATQRTVAVSGTAADPTITVTGTLTAFHQSVGSASPEQTYTIAGSNLKSDVTVAAPADFEISKTTGSGFASSLTFTPTSGTLATAAVYVRMNRSSTGSSSGNISHTSTDAVTQNTAVTGTAYNDTCVTSRISASTDDAEERMDSAAPGYVDIDGDTTSHYLQTYRAYGSPSGTGLNYWGLRFLNVNVPQSATITTATVTFRALATNATESGMTLWGQLAANPTTFVASTSSTYNISSTTTRPRTAATTSWTVPGWTSGSNYSTPELTSIVQEIVNQSGWLANNAMVIVGQASVNQNKTAASFDSSSGSTLAPILSICYTQNTPTIITTGSISAFSQALGSPSTEQSYSISGNHLSGDITVTAPADFEISKTSGSGFTSSLTFTPTDGSLASTPVYVHMNRSTAGASSGNITHDSSGATQKIVAVTGTAGNPTITVTSSMTAFAQIIGTPSPEKTYTLSGTFLKGDITVTAPANFEISKTTSTGFGPSLSFSPANGTLATSTVYVHLNRSTLGASNGDITHTSTDAITQNAAVSGSTTVAPTTVTFQEGVSSYTGTQDTAIKISTPTTTYGTNAYFEWDTQEGGSNGVEIGLLQFANIFGSGVGQIPIGSTITSATLRYRIYTNSGSIGDSASVFESLVNWDEDSTYNTFGAEPGLQAGDYNPSLVATAPATTLSTNYTIDVTASLQRWSAGAANYGWIFNPDGSDGAEAHSSETPTADYRPLLTVNYVESTAPAIATSGTLIPFTTSVSVPSAPQTYTVEGSNLTDDIVLTAPTGFEISTDGTNYYSIRTLTQSGGIVAPATIYVRLHSLSIGTPSGNITHTSVGATTRNVAVSGTVTSGNHAPDAPTLVQPTDNATAVSTSPTLEVTVTDTDANPMDVSFFGRPTTASAEDFTIVVFPDTQKYANTTLPDNYATFYAMTQWIADQQDTRNIVFATHVGDVVEDNLEAGWVVADTAFDTLDAAGVPYSIGFGNNDITGTDASLSETYFGVSRFSGKSWYGGHYGTNNRNNYSLFSASGMDFILVNLDIDPSSTVLDWADALLKANPTRRAIVESHNQLTTSDGWSNQAVFTALQDNPNLFLMLSGHLSSATDGVAKRTDVGSPGGQNIYSVLQDYQSYTNVNNGYLHIYRFSPADDKIYMTTYSPTLLAYNTATDSTLNFNYVMPDAPAYQLIGTVEDVASGGNASISWPGRANDTEYEWYATASDAEATTTGSTWSFTTMGLPVNHAPVVTDIPDQTIAEGASFTTINLDNYVSDVDNTDVEMTWTHSGDSALTVSITNRVATISAPNADWNGAETITFRATDPGSLYDDDEATFTVTGDNDAPVVTDIPNQTIAEGASFTTINLDNYVSDVDNTDEQMVWTNTGSILLTVSIVNRVATIGIPNANWNGAETITFRATDPGALYSEDSATFTVTAVNDAPVAVADTGTTTEDTALVITASDLKTNDTDVDNTNGQLSVTAVSNPTNGTVALVSGTITFTPTANFAGTAGFDYTVSDGALTDTGHVTVTVTAVDDGPVAVDDTGTTAEDTDLVILASTLKTNDTDVDNTNGELSVTAVSNPTNGTVALVSDSITFTPTANFAGTAGYDYTVSDGALTDTGHVTITVTAVNDTPVAVDDTGTTAEDTDLVISANSLRTNDTDVDNSIAQLSVSAVSNPTNGVAVLASGNITFTPAANFAGTAGYDYTVSDGDLTDTGHVTITVTAVNDAPVAVDDEFGTTEDIPIILTESDLKTNDTDVDNSNAQLSVSAVSSPTHGTVTLVSGTVTFTPTAAFVGTAGFDYTLSDGLLTDTGHVTVAITAAANHAPVITESDPQAVTMSEDGSPDGFNLTLHTTDAEPDTHTWSIIGLASHGTASASGTGDLKVIGYTPTANYNGSDSFVVQVSDGSLTDSITVNVTIEAVNDAPVVAGIPDQTVAEGASFTTINLDGYVSDVDNTEAQMTWTNSGNSAFTVSIVSRVATISIPNINWNGAETITFRATDPGTLYDEDSATFTVTAVNDGPVAVDDTGTTAEDTALVITASGLKTNDTDVDNLNSELSVTAVSSPTNGTVTLVSGSITFTPTANFAGTAGFDYTVSDGALTDTGHVTVTVTAVNDAPVAVDDTGTTAEDTALVITASTLKTNDTDVDNLNSELSVTAVSSPTNGTVALVSGSITFTPTANFAGTAGFDYTVSDGSLTDTGHVTVSVTAVNDAPVAVEDTGTTPVNTALVITASTLKTNDTDVDNTNSELSVTAVSNPTNGTVALVSGSITFTPTTSFVGTAGYDYTLSDGALTDTGHVTISVTAVQECTTVNLTATEDTYLSAGDVTYNNGGNTSIHVDATTGTSRRTALIKWDLSSIPTNATVSSTSLSVNVTDASPLVFNLYNMRRSWVEGTSTQAASSTSANWNTYDGVNSWGTVGVANTSTDRFDTNLWGAGTTTFSTTGAKTVDLNTDGIAAVQGWVTTPANNYGLTMQNYSGSTTNAVYFSSSEFTTAANRPILNVSYCTPPPGPAITTTGTLSAFSSQPGVPSTAQTYTVSGTNLTADINITAPTGFEISTDGSNYFSSRVLAQTSGSVSSTTIYVRLNSPSEGTPSGNITHVSTGAPTQNKAVSGTVLYVYSLTAGNDGNGSVTLNPTGGSYNNGTVVTLTPVPNAHYKFSDWSGTNALDIINTSGVYTIVMNGNKSVSANFSSLPQYTLTTAISPDASGSITLNPATGPYDEGTVVTLTPVPASGYAFSSWTGNLSGSTNPTTITMDGNKFVTAIFTVAPTCSTVNLVAAEDTYLSGANTTYNYGGVNLLKSTVNSSGTSRGALLKWDIAGAAIPSDATVSSASMTLYVSTASSATYNLYNMRRSWVEGTLTTGAASTTSANWTTYDGSNTWGTNGAANTSSDRYNTNMWGAGTTTFTPTGSKTVNLNTDGISVVQGWITGSTTNYGVTIQNYSTTSGSDDLQVSSSENTTVANRPKLNITYCVGGATTHTLSISNDGHGTVTVNPDQANYAYGTVVTLTPVANSLYEFSTWSGSDAEDPSDNGNGTWSLVMDSNKSITANFTLLPVNVAPNQPVLVQPLDNATSVSKPPTLEVTVSDSNPADSLDVSFYGRAAGTTSAGDDFTMVVIPDTQNESTSYPAVFTSQTQWIVAQQSTRNIVFVTHVGDLVNTASSTTEYGRADTSMDYLDAPGIPYSVGPGNHDSPTTNYNVYFGRSRFDGKSWTSGSYNTTNDNNYSLFSASGNDFIIINLQYNPSTAQLDWADALLKANPTRRGIVSSHNILNIDNSWSNQAIFTALKDNPNLFLMLCGHMHSASDGSAYRSELGDNGHTIHILQTDYQDYPSGGNGYLRILRFSPANDKIYATIYSPYTSAYLSNTSNYEQMEMVYDLASGSAPAYGLIGTDNDVVNGANASISWPSLLDNTEYEWYATVSDAAETVTGSTWSFTTGTTAINHAPVITESDPQAVSMSEDGAPTAFSKTLNATDADGNTLTWSISSAATHGTATASGTGASKAIGYTPTANYNGSDSFVVQVSDGSLTDTLTVNVTINAVNDAPVITESDPQAVTMSEDGSPTAFSKTLNATDVDSATLTWSISSAATHGTATASGTGASKAIGYTPTANYNGSDSFVVQVSDGSLTDTLTVNVTINAVNDAPVITESDPQAVTMSEDGSPTAFSKMLNATDVDSATLTWSISSAATHGTATASGTGASKVIGYTPTADYNGPDSFVVQVSDGSLTDTITVNVTISAVNDAPIAVDDAYSTTINTDLVVTGVQLRTNDTDVDNTNAQLSVTAVSNPTNGTVALVSGTVTFTPTAAFVGTAGFDYTVSDSSLTDTGHVTITVTAETSFLLSIIKNGTGTGTVTSDIAGISCGSDCTEPYAPSSVVTLTAVAASTSTFAGWSGGGCSGTSTCNVTMDAAKDVTATFTQNVHSISLVQGWNLVSFNLHPTSTAITDVLSTVAGHYDLVYSWDATGASSSNGNWLMYDPSIGYGDTLTTLSENVGFWIHMTQPDNLVVIGSHPTTTNINLLTAAGGWNMVGYPAIANLTLPDALSLHGVGTNFSLIYAFHAAESPQWKLFDRAAEPYVNDLTSMAPGWGYWVKVSTDSTWHVEFTAP